MQCYICFETGPLIQPCSCITLPVHISCLKHAIEVRAKKNYKNSLICPTCKRQYNGIEIKQININKVNYLGLLRIIRIVLYTGIIACSTFILTFILIKYIYNLFACILTGIIYMLIFIYLGWKCLKQLNDNIPLALNNSIEVISIDCQQI